LSRISKVIIIFVLSFLFVAVPSIMINTNASTPTANACTSTAHLILKPFNAAPASNVQLTGKCFDGNSSVSVSLCDLGGSSCSQVANPTTNGTGYFHTSFTLPSATLPGSHIMKATESSNPAKTASNILTVISSIKLSPVRFIVSGKVLVNGVGFRPMQMVTLMFAGQTVNSTTTNSSGAFKSSFIVPHTPAGSYIVSASDGTYSATKSFTVVPSAYTPFNHYAPPGGTLQLTGYGFGANSLVTFTMNNSASLGSVMTNSVGDFTYSAPIPSNTPKGTFTIACVDASGNSKTVTFHDFTK
jgi:hypothetical protein